MSPPDNEKRSVPDIIQSTLDLVKEKSIELANQSTG